MASSPRIDELTKKFEENPRRYFAPLANEYRKSGDLEHAIAICREYLPQQPGHMSGHIVFGQALFEAGQLDEARTVFETALTLDPENLIALRHLGDIAQQGGDLAGARSWYQRVLDADPRNEEIAAQLAALPAAEPAPADAAPAPEPIELQLPTEPASAPAPGAAPAPRQAPHAAPHAAAPSAPAAPAAPAAPEPAIEKTPELSVEGLMPTQFGGEAPAAERTAGGRQAAEPAAADDLGLEVMEFVPPSRADRPTPSVPLDTKLAYGGHGQGEDVEAETPAAFITETMAELYLQQGFTAEALDVYRKLLEQNPSDAHLRERVSALEAGSRSSVGAAADISDAVIEEAQKRQATHSVLTARAFFGALAIRRAPERAGTADEESGAFAPPEPADAGWGAAPAARGERLPGPTGYALPELPGFDEEPSADREAAAEAPSEGGAADLPFLEPFPVREAAAPEAPEPAPAPEPADVEPRWEAAEPTPAREPVREPARAPEPEPARPVAGVPTANGRPGSGSLDVLFGVERVDGGDENAASLLARAFGTGELPAVGGEPPRPETPIGGRPSERAPTELTLDAVFRDSDRPRSRRSTGEFSFDQFFSEQPASEEGVPSTSDAEAGAPEDIQQFNSWLQGLKKK